MSWLHTNARPLWARSFKPHLIGRSMTLDLTSPDLVGYCDRFHYRPGEVVEVHAHGNGPVRVDLVTLHGADERVAVSLPLEREVPTVQPQTVPLSPQTSYPGSFAFVEDIGDLSQSAELTVEMWIFPTLPGNGRRQSLLSLWAAEKSGLDLGLAPDGQLELRTGQDKATLCRTEKPILAKHWMHVRAVLSVTQGKASIEFSTKLPLPDAIAKDGCSGELSSLPLQGPGTVLAIAASGVYQTANGRKYGADTFNGKIDAVRILAAQNGDVSPQVVVSWDFSLQMDTATVVDVSGADHHGVLVNAPTRAMTGPNWTGDEVDFRHVPQQYGAIHFHDDDLEEAGWDVAARLRLPSDLPSGVYAVRLDGDGVGDRIPIFVLPCPNGPKAPVAFLASTFTYQAYANILMEGRDYEEEGISGIEAVPAARDIQSKAFPFLAGSSLYDKHSDGSGRCYSSYKRPIFNFRADHKNPTMGGPRNFGADLYLTSWLTHIGQQFDVLTDHALDGDAEILTGYKVLLTGSHPEYWSGRMLSALERFIEAGGKVMYLGGNGFHWVTSQDPCRPHMIECRRGYAGTRPWGNEPGETHLSSTGEYGGNWRHRGRSANKLVGVGTASQGWDERAPGYTKTGAGKSAEFGWIFAGVEENDFGNFGFSMGGAAGDEIDRYDVSLGSPVHGVVVATSQPHSQFYKILVEDVEMIINGLDGPTDKRVRSDIVLLEWRSSGAVFSVGSINWAASLAWNNFENSVERVTRNVLHGFLK